MINIIDKKGRLKAVIYPEMTLDESKIEIIDPLNEDHTEVYRFGDYKMMIDSTVHPASQTPEGEVKKRNENINGIDKEINKIDKELLDLQRQLDSLESRQMSMYVPDTNPSAGQPAYADVKVPVNAPAPIFMPVSPRLLMMPSFAPLVGRIISYFAAKKAYADEPMEAVEEIQTETKSDEQKLRERIEEL